jgi:uncharacterized protein with GYD domain
MSIYVALYKWTEQGIMNVKDSPTRAQINLKAVEAAGGKVIGFWYTDGPYDIVAVAEWANDEAVAAVSVGAGSSGVLADNNSQGTFTGRICRDRQDDPIGLLRNAQIEESPGHAKPCSYPVANR